MEPKQHRFNVYSKVVCIIFQWESITAQNPPATYLDRIMLYKLSNDNIIAVNYFNCSTKLNYTNRKKNYLILINCFPLVYPKSWSHLELLSRVME